MTIILCRSLRIHPRISNFAGIEIDTLQAIDGENIEIAYTA